MDSNLSLSLGFKGQLTLNAQAVPLQEGYLKLGGIVDSTETAGLSFGVVVSADTDTPDQFTKGCASGNIVRGICVFDDAIAQNSPAHPNTYLAGMPCAAINHGFLWLASWITDTTTLTGAISPVIGCIVVYNTTTGAIGFLAAGTSTIPDGFSQLSNASVRSVDADNGALIYLD